MNLAISNIAWDPLLLDAALDAMDIAGVTGLEIAPGLAFFDQPDPFDPSREAIDAFSRKIRDRHVHLVSMQSLLFGVSGANMFGDEDERARFSEGVERAIRLAGRLEIANLVLGSPTQRVIPEGMDRDEATRVARDVLGPLGEIAKANGASLALEPNPAIYGTNFLTTAAEALRFVVDNDVPGITMNFDLGAILVNAEQAIAPALFAEGRSKISHVHISEPQLAPAPADEKWLVTVVRAIMQTNYDGWYSIEMRKPDGDQIEVVAECLRRARHALETAGEG